MGPTTTTTLAPTTTVTPTTTTLAPTTSVPTVAAPTTSTSTSTPETVLNAPPTVPALPRTGVDVVAVAMLGFGLVLLGAAALELRRQRTTVG